ncbi:hypothetical protein CSUI_003281 [Cystoisospora suis]|uniref:J domain-containing protein n=1 Tax=Cystoisospora suis TaxID=483139 RepID=A0A2C6L5R9_9APIC|nr:hypothetical protein CSUI_003281 [Cystoisospora suis]
MPRWLGHREYAQEFTLKAGREGKACCLVKSSSASPSTLEYDDSATSSEGAGPGHSKGSRLDTRRAVHYTERGPQLIRTLHEPTEARTFRVTTSGSCTACLGPQTGTAERSFGQREAVRAKYRRRRETGARGNFPAEACGRGASASLPSVRLSGGVPSGSEQDGGLRQNKTPVHDWYADGEAQVAGSQLKDYAVLGVGPSADARVIRKAFFRLAAKAHPDKGGSNEDRSFRHFQCVVARVQRLRFPLRYFSHPFKLHLASEITNEEAAVDENPVAIFPLEWIPQQGSALQERVPSQRSDHAKSVFLLVPSSEASPEVRLPLLSVAPNSQGPGAALAGVHVCGPSSPSARADAGGQCSGRRVQTHGRCSAYQRVPKLRPAPGHSPAGKRRAARADRHPQRCTLNVGSRGKESPQTAPTGQNSSPPPGSIRTDASCLRHEDGCGVSRPGSAATSNDSSPLRRSWWINDLEAQVLQAGSAEEHHFTFLQLLPPPLSQRHPEGNSVGAACGTQQSTPVEIHKLRPPGGEEETSGGTPTRAAVCKTHRDSNPLPEDMEEKQEGGESIVGLTRPSGYACALPDTNTSERDCGLEGLQEIKVPVWGLLFLRTVAPLGRLRAVTRELRAYPPTLPMTQSVDEDKERPPVVKELLAAEHDGAKCNGQPQVHQAVASVCGPPHITEKPGSSEVDIPLGAPEDLGHASATWTREPQSPVERVKRQVARVVGNLRREGFPLSGEAVVVLFVPPWRAPPGDIELLASCDPPSYRIDPAGDGLPLETLKHSSLGEESFHTVSDHARRRVSRWWRAFMEDSLSSDHASKERGRVAGGLESGSRACLGRDTGVPLGNLSCRCTTDSSGSACDTSTARVKRTGRLRSEARHRRVPLIGIPVELSRGAGQVAGEGANISTCDSATGDGQFIRCDRPAPETLAWVSHALRALCSREEVVHAKENTGTGYA